MAQPIEQEGTAKPYQLIVTLFAQRKKTEKEDTTTPFPEEKELIIDSTNEYTLGTILSSLDPTLSLPAVCSRFLSPRVLQLTYATSTLLSPANLRHHPSLIALEEQNSLELTFRLLPHPQPSNIPLTLAVFDMDSTLIDQEVIDELARSINVTPLVSAITARAMAGELDFAASLKERVRLLEGVRADVWETLKSEGRVTLARGAKELCRALRRLGVRMAVVSGGFVEMAEWVKEELGLDYAFANHLLTSPPTSRHPYTHLTGHLSPTHPIVTASLKRSLLLDLASPSPSSSPPPPPSLSPSSSQPSNTSTDLSTVLAVGDGANDLEMLLTAGWGVGFRAKERVQREAPNRLNSESLVDLLHLFGYDEGEIGELTRG